MNLKQHKNLNEQFLRFWQDQLKNKKIKYKSSRIAISK